MQASPLRTHRRPGYPTRLEIDADRELLRRHLPVTWAARPELATAAALLLTLAIPGCKTPPTAPATPPPTTEEKPAPTAAATNSIAIVAPVFEHGVGRSATGCVVVTPPVFLSEEDAWLIIDEELAKRGLALTEKEHVIPGIGIPLYSTADLERLKEGDPLPKPLSIEPLKADRAAPERKIVLEFVSADNPPEKTQSWNMGSIGGIEMKGEAEVLRQLVSTDATEKIYFGALYDPVVDADWSHADLNSIPDNPTDTDRAKLAERIDAQARAESKRLLRLQVQDFIKWLQAQGAI